MSKRANPEAVLQKSVAQFLRAALKPGVMWRMVENNPRSAIAGARAKARGVQRGTPDILLWCYDGFFAIELKSKVGRQSPEQKDFQHEFESVGGLYAVCRSLSEVEAVLRQWKLPMRGIS